MTSQQSAEIDKLISSIAHDALQACQQSLAEASSQEERLAAIDRCIPVLRALHRMKRKPARRPKRQSMCWPARPSLARDIETK
jgi:hypothetical protein